MYAAKNYALLSSSFHPFPFFVFFSSFTSTRRSVSQLFERIKNNFFFRESLLLILRKATLSHSRILQPTPEQQASHRLLLQYFSLFLLLRSLSGRLHEGEMNLIWLLTAPNGISGRARAERWIDDCRKKRRPLCDSGAYFRVSLSLQMWKPPSVLRGMGKSKMDVWVAKFWKSSLIMNVGDKSFSFSQFFFFFWRPLEVCKLAWTVDCWRN